MSLQGIGGILRLAGGQHGVISSRQALAHGMTRSDIGRLRAGDLWSSLLAGVYLVHAVVPFHPWADLPFMTRVAAAALAHGPEAVFSRDSAARLLGLPGLGTDPGLIDLTLRTGRERHQQPGVFLRTGKLGPTLIRQVALDHLEGHGPGLVVSVTSPELTIADLLRTLGRWDAVSLFDAVLCHEHIDPTAVSDVLVHVDRRRGAVRARCHAAASDGRAQSPLETRVRLIATDSGMPPDELQFAVRDRFGTLLGYGDLAWHRPGRRTLVAEADGKAWHDTPSALFRDRRRANDFSATDEVDVVRFTWQDTLRRRYIESVLGAHLRSDLER